MNFIEHALGRFRPRRFRIDAQHGLRSRSTHHRPADFTEVNFHAVEILAAHHRPIEKAIQFRRGKIFERLLLLPVLQRQIHAPVMMLAEFPVQHRHQFAQFFAVPGHHLGEQQRAHRRVAFREVQFRADPAALLAAQYDVAFQHALADVFETDGCLPHFPAELRGDLVDHFRHRE